VLLCSFRQRVERRADCRSCFARQQSSLGHSFPRPLSARHCRKRCSQRLPFRSTRPICCSRTAGFHSAWNCTTTRQDSWRFRPSLPTWLCATRTQGEVPRRLKRRLQISPGPPLRVALQEASVETLPVVVIVVFDEFSPKIQLGLQDGEVLLRSDDPKATSPSMDALPHCRVKRKRAGGRRAGRGNISRLGRLLWRRHLLNVEMIQQMSTLQNRSNEPSLAVIENPPRSIGSLQ
jgi:hypothetical protein